jgi:uncharacterized protein (TIGR02466 family)
MPFINLFPTVVFSSILEDISQNEIKNYIDILKDEKLIDYNNYGSSTLDQNILDIPIFSKLKNSILDFSKEYIKNLGFKDYDFQICNSWGNIVDKNEEIMKHKHLNSFLSGCFYLSPNNSDISFVYPLSDKWLFYLGERSFFDKEKPQTWETFRISPQQNQILLFPSWLEHFVHTSKNDNRVSIAFNLIPKGKLGKVTSIINL